MAKVGFNGQFAWNWEVENNIAQLGEKESRIKKL